MILTSLGLTALAGWVGMAVGRGGFWRIDREPAPPGPARWPSVVSIVPARNEEHGVGETVRSLWAQDYPGGLRVVVDDHSEDRTAEVVRETAAAMGATDSLVLLRADPLPEGWAGKVWAMQQGLDRGVGHDDPASYVLFSDADISHGPDAVRDLVARAEAHGCDLASFMVMLECRSWAEKLMIPAFVFFFRLLYPFRLVSDPASRVAGAAGGTMLVRRTALERIGGLAGIKNAVIDDCALGAAVKRGGHRVWLGLSESSRSTRRYGGLREVLDMVARSAYVQLRCSPPVLLACVLGLLLAFVVPPALVLTAQPAWPMLLGAAAWVLMGVLYLPTVRLYGQSAFLAVTLPLTGVLYLWATVLSGWRHHRGRGGMWKGRSQATR